MLTKIRQVVCNRKGHNWDTYTVSTGYGSNEIEQAGYCLRCKYDTHGEYVHPPKKPLFLKGVLKRYKKQNSTTSDPYALLGKAGVSPKHLKMYEESVEKLNNK